MKKFNIFKSAFSQSIVIFLSRILGLFRNILIASFFGVSPVASAFLVAFKIPYRLRKILGESALDAFFVPVYTKLKKDRSLKEVNIFISNLINVIGLFVLVFIIVSKIFMPQVLSVLISGMKNLSPAAMNIAIILSKITIVFLFTMPIIAIFMGLFHANGSFLLPATNSIVLNIFVIGTLLYYGFKVENSALLGLKISYIYVVAGFFIVFYQYFIIKKRYSFKYYLRFSLKRMGIRRIFRMMVPATISMAVMNINFLIDTFIASFIREGAGISILNYAEIIVQFPIGVIGVAVFNTSLPKLSEYVKTDNIKRAKQVFEKLLIFLVTLALPISFGLLAIKSNFISLIYQYKNFNPADVPLVSNVLKYFLIGMIGFLGVRIVASLFYAKEEVQIPLKVSVISVSINIVLNFLFVFSLKMNTGGLALASSIAGLTNFSILLYIVNKKYFKINFIKLLKVFFKSFLISIIMYFAVKYSISFFTLDGFISKILSVILPVIFGIVIYFTLSVVFKLEGFKELINKIFK